MQLREHWPLYLQALEEFDQVAEGLQPEFDEATNRLRAAPDDFFLVSLSEYGVQRWEKIFGITPDPATETLEVRRQRVYNRYLLQTPFTIRFLRARLDDMIGAGRYTLELDHGNYILRVASGCPEYAWIRELLAFVAQIKPANMEFHLDLSVSQRAGLFMGAAGEQGETIEVVFIQDESAEATAYAFTGALGVVGEIISNIA